VPLLQVPGPALSYALRHAARAGNDTLLDELLRRAVQLELWPERCPAEPTRRSTDTPFDPVGDLRHRNRVHVGALAGVQLGMPNTRT
jgi:hypothetical protein